MPIISAGLLLLGVGHVVGAPSSTWTNTSEQYGPVDMGVDSSGNMFTAGSTEYPPVNGETVSYDNMGTVRWVETYTGYEATREYAVTPDGSGGCVSAGNTYVPGMRGPVQVALTIKYSSSGSQSWANTLSGSVGGSDARATAVVQDSSGNVYVTGHIENTTTGEDVFTIKYTGTGSVAWLKTWDDGANGVDGGNGIVLDSSGNVYVSGTISSGTYSGVSASGVLLKYDSSGNLKWAQYTTGNGSKSIAAASATSHKVYVANGSVCQYQDNGTSGSLVWDSATAVTPYPAGPISQVVVDSSDEVFGVNSGTSLVTTRLDPSTGGYIPSGWPQTYSGFGVISNTVRAIAVDNAGYVYVTGNDSSLTTVVALKYSTSGGSYQDVYTSATYGGSGTFAVGIGPDGSGNAFVLGGTPMSGLTNILAIGLIGF